MSPERTDLLTLATFRDLPDAELARSKLDSEGIDSYLVNDHLVAMAWGYSTAVGGVKIVVRSEDLATARQALAEDRSSEVEATMQSVDSDLCPRCGSPNIAYYRLERPFAALTLVIPLPLPIFGKRLRCKACGFLWKRPRK